MYPPKKDTQVETKTKLICPTNNYLLTIRESATSTMIYIGGAHTYCLECQIINKESIANLCKIQYSETCSLGSRFERGKDTKTILGILVSHIRKNYPYIKHLKFEDMSYRECSDSGHSISLADFYYLLHGETWYMKHMGATFAETKDQTNFIALHERFRQRKTTLGWNEFDTYVTAKHPLPENEMQALYETTATWQDFFNALLERVDIGDLCIYMAPWVKTFMHRVAQIKFHSYAFLLPIENAKLPTIKCDTEPFIQRGGKYTRRIRPSRWIKYLLK